MNMFIGIIASLIAWWIVNILLIPKFDISELLYNNKSRPYIKVWNKSWHHLSVYEVVCYIYYYQGAKEEHMFIREDNRKPILIKGNRDKNMAIIKLDGHEKLKDFFQNGNRLKIVVTGQNRFGVKQVFTKEIIVNNISV